MNSKEKNIWEIAARYRGFVLSENITQATIRTVFSKYLVDNYLYASTKEEMMLYADAQKAIASLDAMAFIETLQPIMQMIDIKLQTAPLLSDIPYQIKDDILGSSGKKYRGLDDPSDRFMQILRNMDFTDNEDNLYDALADFIYSSAEKGSRRGADSVTNRSLVSLAAKLLDAGKTDTYLDFACGYGLSSFEIIKDEEIGAVLTDANQENVQIALILSIIKQRKTQAVHIVVADPLAADKFGSFSRIFVDFPLGARIDREVYGTSDGNLLAIKRVIESLGQDGRAVVTCPSGLLFKESKEVMEFRKELVDQKLIEAVVSLPALMYGSTVNVNILILSKKNNTDVVMVDASSNSCWQFSNNVRSRNTELTEEGISKIVEIIHNHEEIEGVSKTVEGKVLLEKNTFVPASFIDVPKKKQMLSSTEIQDRLSELYNKLQEQR